MDHCFPWPVNDSSAPSSGRLNDAWTAHFVVAAYVQNTNKMQRAILCCAPTLSASRNVAKFTLKHALQLMPVVPDGPKNKHCVKLYVFLVISRNSLHWFSPPFANCPRAHVMYCMRSTTVARVRRRGMPTVDSKRFTKAWLKRPGERAARGLRMLLDPEGDAGHRHVSLHRSALKRL